MSRKVENPRSFVLALSIHRFLLILDSTNADLDCGTVIFKLKKESVQKWTRSAQPLFKDQLHNAKPLMGLCLENEGLESALEERAEEAEGSDQLKAVTKEMKKLGSFS